MSECKKRVRPTVAQVKALEETVSRLGEALRSKDEVIRGYEEKDRMLSSENEELKGIVRTLEQSNMSMEGELNRKGNRHETELKHWKEKAIECETEMMRLQSRGFWSRLFNL